MEVIETNRYEKNKLTLKNLSAACFMSGDLAKDGLRNTAPFAMASRGAGPSYGNPIPIKICDTKMKEMLA